MPVPGGRWTGWLRRRSPSSKLDTAPRSREELHHCAVLEALPCVASIYSTLGGEELPALERESSAPRAALQTSRPQHLVCPSGRALPRAGRTRGRWLCLVLDW